MSNDGDKLLSEIERLQKRIVKSAARAKENAEKARMATKAKPTTPRRLSGPVFRQKAGPGYLMQLEQTDKGSYRVLWVEWTKRTPSKAVQQFYPKIFFERLPGFLPMEPEHVPPEVAKRFADYKPGGAP